MTSVLENTIQHEGRVYRLEDRETFLAYIKQAREQQPSSVALHPAVAPSDRPATVSLAQYQTPIKDQKDRGTCWAFAGAAAVEAAYKRKYNVTLDLSEQYIFHMAKVQELVYDDMSAARTHENNSTLWDGQGASDIIVKMTYSAVCPEAAAPYIQSQAAMEAIQKLVPNGNTLGDPSQNPLQSVMDAFELREDLIPSAARTQCRYMVVKSSDPGTYNSATLEGVIAGGHEVAVDIVTQYKTDQNGVWQYDSTVQGAGHCLLLIGYDHSNQYFLAKNSWGGTAFTKIGYGFIDKCCSWAHVVTDVADPNMTPQKRAFWVGTWNLDFDGWRGTLNFRRSINYRATDTNAPTRLGTYVRAGVEYDVNGSFSENFQQCTFYIAPSAARVTPGTLTGQRFDVYCFSWDINHAAGRTTSNGATYGVVMSRPPLPAEKSNTFNVNNWIGNYAMNYDGWPGTLHITSVSPFAATYKNSKNVTSAVQGKINNHELTMTIDFPGNAQPFDLFYHTWELGVFSGTTQSGGTTYGVFGTLA